MTHDIDANNLIELLKTDLVEGAKELVENWISHSELLEESSVPNEIEHRLEVEQMECENDGDGNEARAVVKFMLDNRLLGYVRFTGSYGSYSGYEWDNDPILVHPKNVVVLKYLAVDGSEDDEYLEVFDSPSTRT